MTKSPLNPKVIWFSVCTDGCWLTRGRDDGTSRLAGAQGLVALENRFTGWIAFWRTMSYSVVISNTAQRWGFPASGLMGITSLWIPIWCKDVACSGYLGVTPNNNTECFKEKATEGMQHHPVTSHVALGSATQVVSCLRALLHCSHK